MVAFRDSSPASETQNPDQGSLADLFLNVGRLYTTAAEFLNSIDNAIEVAGVGEGKELLADLWPMREKAEEVEAVLRRYLIELYQSMETKVVPTQSSAATKEI